VFLAVAKEIIYWPKKERTENTNYSN